VATNSKIETVFPTRGVAGGWRDPWDEPGDCAQCRARAETIERRQTRRVDLLGTAWQHEIRAEQKRQRRGGVGYQLHGAV
jgi:hypothetical protein